MAKQVVVTWKPMILPITLCLLAGPITYLFNNVAKDFSPAKLFGAASLILLTVIMAAVVCSAHVKNKMFYAFCLFAFTSAVDFFIPLEADGYVKGFMDTYLKSGEPYLMSSWGVISAYWDGTFYLGCYLVMAYRALNGFSYRTLGLYYSANILNSMVVLLVGAFLSQVGVGWCTLLNVPYVVVPVVVAVQCITEPRKRKVKPRKRTWVDDLLILLLLEATIAALLRGIAALGSNVEFFFWYREQAEPILNDNIPAPFAAVQGIMNLFYFAPAFLILAGGIFKNPGQAWLKDLAVITAGATLQAQVEQIGMSYHPLTIPNYHAPTTENTMAFLMFWASNILVTIVPQLTAFVLCCDIAHGTQVTSRKKT